MSTISYPLIVEGKVFVLVDNRTENGTNLYALDQATGATVWGPFQDKFGSFSFAGLAYDAGRVFVLNFDGFLRAFDASTGAMVWETFLAGEYPDHRILWEFTSPPTAVGGTVYVSGAGLGTEVLAVSEQDGTLKWFVCQRWTALFTGRVGVCRLRVILSCSDYGFITYYRTVALAEQRCGRCLGTVAGSLQ
jgi:outer membrane protein assembly factor BamB